MHESKYSEGRTMSRSESKRYSKWVEYKPLRIKSGRGTCRCPICGQNNAGDNHIRNSYLRVGLIMDEQGFFIGSSDKKDSRKLRRTRERNIFQNDLLRY